MPRLDAMQAARDFLYQPRTKVRPSSPARRLAATERMAREAVTMAATSGGGSASSVPIFDSLPDATLEDVGSIIYVAGAAGQPARGYMGVQTQNDTVIWEPVFTQAFYGAATSESDELYTLSNCLVGGTSATAPTQQNAGPGHPGVWAIFTQAAIGSNKHIRKGVFSLADILKTAQIFQTDSTIANMNIRVGVWDSGSWPPTAGIYVEKLAADTNWFLVKEISNVQTRVDSGIAVAASKWWLVQIEDPNLGAGIFNLSLTNLTDGGVAVATTQLTGLNESSGSAATFAIESTSAAVRQLNADFIWIENQALVRS